VNYARKALWKRSLTTSERNARCALFSTSVATDNATVDLADLCTDAVAASTAIDAFWTALDTNCYGVWNSDYTTQTAAPVLGHKKCSNKDRWNTLKALSGNNTADIDINGDGVAEPLKKQARWKLLNKGARGVRKTSLNITIRQNRCSNFSYDNSSSSSDNGWGGSGNNAFNNVPTSMKDLCLNAVNSGSATIIFDDAMTALTAGPFVNWSLTFADNDTKRISVTGTQPWEKTYKLLLNNGTALQWDNSSNSSVWWKYYSTDNTTFPGKHSVASYLQEVVHPQSLWNPNGITASEIPSRCEFFTATDNISTYCSQMPTYIEGVSVLMDRSRLQSSTIPFFINLNDPRIKKRSSNGYLFDNPKSALTLYTRVFPKETFNGSTTWSSSTTFNAEQVFALLFTFFESRSKTPIPSSPVYGVLDGLSSNQKAWLDWDVMSLSFLGDEKDMFLPLLNALDNPAALR